MMVSVYSRCIHPLDLQHNSMCQPCFNGASAVIWRFDWSSTGAKCYTEGKEHIDKKPKTIKSYFTSLRDQIWMREVDMSVEWVRDDSARNSNLKDCKCQRSLNLTERLNTPWLAPISLGKSSACPLIPGACRALTSMVASIFASFFLFCWRFPTVLGTVHDLFAQVPFVRPIIFRE